MATVLITGGHSGVGLAAARTLAKRYGHDLILAGRSPEKMEAVARELRSEAGVAVDMLPMDLSSLDSVRAGAAQCVAMLENRGSARSTLESIVCNAGVQTLGPVSYAVDGYEETFASNCLGHFLMTNLLLDSLAPHGRVVWTASGTHDPALTDGKTVGAAAEPDANALARGSDGTKPLSGGRRYSTSKLCTILYAYELDRKLRRAGSDAASIAYDPGFIPDTGLGRLSPTFLRTSVAKSVLKMMGVTMGRMPFSGEALAMLAADATYAGVSGKYFHSKDGALRETRSSTASYDEAKAAKLWSDSETLVRLQADERPRSITSGASAVR